jgi:hypothetical protein
VGGGSIVSHENMESDDGGGGHVHASGVHLPRPLVCDVRDLVAPDLSSVEDLARIQLIARRIGCCLRFEHAPERLRELIALTGLASVLNLDEEDSGLEAWRESEQREQAPGVEEEADPADPAP